MSLFRNLASGLIGAGALTLLHETARRNIPEAPRMDLLGMRALARMMRAAGREPPDADRLHQVTLVGDLVSNGLYYSLVGAGGPDGALLRGALLGLAAGAGAVLLPGPLGLGTAPAERTTATAAMTVGWYLVGGLAAAAAYRLLAAGEDGAAHTPGREAFHHLRAPAHSAV